MGLDFSSSTLYQMAALFRLESYFRSVNRTFEKDGTRAVDTEGDEPYIRSLKNYEMKKMATNGLSRTILG